MSPYRSLAKPTERRRSSIANRALVTIAEQLLERDVCAGFRWYRRAVGGTWVKKQWWFVSGCYTWVKADGPRNEHIFAHEEYEVYP